MKYPILTFILLTLFSINQLTLSAQLYDNTWMMGCCYSENQRLNGGINLRFDRGFSDTSYFSRTISFNRTSMSISNPNNGDILFYSNGCDIYNKNDQVMDGGLEINPGIPYIQVCKQTTLGYYLAKGGAILEWPDRPTEFAVIHRAYKNSGIGDTVDHLYYSSVDLNKNAGLGRVIKKNVILYQGDMYKRHFDIVKHANGRDWWIITYKVKSDTALTFLLQPDGFKGPFKQSFPIERYEEDFTPNSAISNDGTIIARIDPFIGIFLSSFNRETGIFSTLKKYPYWLDPNSVVISGFPFHQIQNICTLTLEIICIN
ncbi:MAG: hypothetical protein IPH93_07780 [Saprospiraceae bacterium]|nr:hypothetical protein [Saprospiraceae bacterium]